MARWMVVGARNHGVGLLTLLWCGVALSQAASPYLIESFDVRPNGDSIGSGQGACAYGSLVYFSARTTQGVHALWRTDGTVEGTQEVECAGVEKASKWGAKKSSTGREKYLNQYDDGTFVSAGENLYIIINGFLWVVTEDGGAAVRLTEISLAQSPVAWGNLLVYVTYGANGVNGGTALWRSDGTSEGTIMLSPPESSESLFHKLSGGVGGRFLFTQRDAEYGEELWATDGTPEGTSILLDICPGPSSSSPSIYMLLHNGVAYFSANDGSHGWEPWRTDGTKAGTYLLQDIFSGGASSNPRSFLSTDHRVVFFADDGEVGQELWQSDGTPSGTSLVRDISPGPAGMIPSPLCSAGGEAYFSLSPGTPYSELWRSDGTPGGTYSVSAFCEEPRQVVRFLAQVDDEIYFFCGDPTMNGRLWRSDGTEAGTREIIDLSADGPGSSFSGLGVVDGRVLFKAQSSETGSALYVTDGTASGTFLLRRFVPEEVGANVWRMEVSERGILFGASASFRGNEPWWTDGTVQGTYLLNDINRSYSCDLEGFAVLEEHAYFSAKTEGAGRELWRTDGTDSGTAQVAEICSIYYSEENPNPEHITVSGESVFFSAVEREDPELWRTDGTSDGTVKLTGYRLGSQLMTNPMELTAAANMLYFTGQSRADGVEFWKTDAKPGNTLYVRAFHPECGAGNNDMTAAGGGIFWMFSGDLGWELWWTDGSSDGSTLLKRVFTKNAPAQPLLTAVGTSVFFSASDPENGTELWKSDGTPGGTVLVKDILPGSEGSFPGGIIAAGGATVYFRAEDGTSGCELWRSDGTAAGTRLVRDVFAGPSGSFPEHLTPSGGILFFSAEDGLNGRELWKTDGTASGTVMVLDILKGPLGSILPESSGFVSRNGNLFFPANDGIAGLELWTSDGTAGGTLLYVDIRPGAEGGCPAGLTMLGQCLVFSVCREGTDVQSELWGVLLPVPAAPSNPTASNLGTSHITWNWSDNSDDEDGFKVWEDPGAAVPETLRVITGPGVTQWRQDGLAANTLHSFQVAATGYDGDSLRTELLSVYTWAEVPLPPVLSNPTSSSVQVAVESGDGNSPDTEYAILHVPTGEWVQPDGTLRAVQVWATAATWGMVSVTGLAPATEHAFSVYARNGDGLPTAQGLPSVTETLVRTPNLEGQTRGSAETVIVSTGLVLDGVDELYHDSVPEGIVMGQAPAGGVDVPAGTGVFLTVSKGKDPTGTDPQNEGEGEGESPSIAEAAAILTEKFALADADKDGRLSYEEAAAVVPNITETVFDELDANGNGYLELEEINLEEGGGGCFGCNPSAKRGAWKDGLANALLAGFALQCMVLLGLFRQ